MPTPLPTISLTGVVAGNTGKIDLTPAAPTSNPRFTNAPATLQIYNESGAGLRLSGKNTGLSFDLPAGGWNNIEVPAGETEIDYSVAYVLPNPNVATLLMTYFSPGETAHPTAGLGNSPLNSLPVTIQASSVANDTTSVDTEFIEASITSTKHVSMTTGGGLTLTQLAAVLFQINKTLGGSSQTFAVLNATDKFKYRFDQDTNGTLHIFDATNSLDTITLNSLGGNTLDNNNIVTNGAGAMQVKSIQGATGGKLKGISQFSGTGTVVGAAHGLGTTPTSVFVMSNGTAADTFKWGNPTGTTVDITEGSMSSVAWVAIALAF